jgi:hypothetical protein
VEIGTKRVIEEIGLARIIHGSRRVPTEDALEGRQGGGVD